MLLIVSGVLFLLLFAAVCWWLLFPESGERATRRLADRGRRWRERLGLAGRRTLERPLRTASEVRSLARESRGFVFRHRWLLVAALLLLAVPPLVILSVRRNVALEDFQAADLSESGSMIAQLLRGERLVPPPPPPPEVFTTEEILRLRPEIAHADRRWEHIDARLQQQVLAIYEIMRRHGYQMVLVEGYRSPERQAELIEAGKATRAGAWQSCHQYGLAVDSAPMRDGRLQWDMSDPWTRRGYFLYGELARQAGLEWGGSWRSIKDYVHLEDAQACRDARAARRRQPG